MIDLAAICTALAARFAPGTITTPANQLAMRKAYANPPKGIPATPAVVLEVVNGQVIANPGEWNHTIDIDMVFCVAKRQADTIRADAQRQAWLGTLLAATEAQIKLTLGGSVGYSVDKAIPTGWEFDEYQAGSDLFDAIRIHFKVWVRETVSLTP